MYLLTHPIIPLSLCVQACAKCTCIFTSKPIVCVCVCVCPCVRHLLVIHMLQVCHKHGPFNLWLICTMRQCNNVGYIRNYIIFSIMQYVFQFVQ